MITYPYNRTSLEGRRLFKLLDVQFNKATLNDKTGNGQSFETYEVPTVMQCRANKVGFLFESNLSGIKRPQIRIEADVELAWGNFAEGITALDFTHGQELPLTYVQPLEDDTLKLLIDAGLYHDERFEELMSKLMLDELFEAEADMMVSYLDVGAIPEQANGVPVVPVLLVDPVNVVHEDFDVSEHTTLADLVKRSATLAIELRQEGVKMDELVNDGADRDHERFIDDSFRDVVSQKEEEAIEQEVDGMFTASSTLLDQEIDVTEKLKGSLTIDHTNEDDRIRDLKDSEWADQVAATQELDPAESKTKLVEAIDNGDANTSFPDISGGYSFEAESTDDGPDL